jgi:DNA replication protein DnaC
VFSIWQLTMQSPSKKARQELRHAPSQQQQPGQQLQHMTAVEFRDHAVSFLASRLMVTQHCPQAASLQLRPSLQKAQQELLSTITSAVQLKQNASLLVLGEPGIGKTLVSTQPAACQGWALQIKQRS